MTHALASIPQHVLGEEVCHLHHQREVVNASIDFFDGI
ncbi:hypothetical protein ACMYSK_19695 [Klebsiella sp. I138]